MALISVVDRQNGITPMIGGIGQRILIVVAKRCGIIKVVVDLDRIRR